MVQSAKHTTDLAADSHRPNHGPPRHGRTRTWAAAFVLGLAIVVVYGRVLRAPLIFDDLASVTQNTSIVSLWPLIGSADKPGPLRPPPDTPVAGRPLVNLSLALNYQLGGLAPAGFRVFNIGLHALSALLMFGIVRRTLQLHRFGNEFANSADALALAV